MKTESSGNHNGVTNRSMEKVIAGNETTYATGAAGLYNGKGQLVSSVNGNNAVAAIQNVGYNNAIGTGHTSAFSNGRPIESYSTVGTQTTSSISFNTPQQVYEMKKDTSTSPCSQNRAKVSYQTQKIMIAKEKEKEKERKKKSTSSKTSKNAKSGNIAVSAAKNKKNKKDSVIKELASLGMGFVPYAGDIKDVVDFAAGKDVITNEKLSVDERAATLIALIPAVSGPEARGGLKMGKNALETVEKIKAGRRAADSFQLEKKTIKNGLVKKAEKEVKKVGKKVKDGIGDVVKKGKKVSVEMDIKYSDSSGRPKSFDVFYYIEGIPFFKHIEN